MGKDQSCNGDLEMGCPMMVPVCGGDAQCDVTPQQEFKAHLRINANLCTSGQSRTCARTRRASRAQESQR